MTFHLPDLPYAKDALHPHVSVDTMTYHHDKHHSAYVDKLNAAVEGADYADMELDDVVRTSFERGDTAVFNNAAQTWNHTFFWNSMTPEAVVPEDHALTTLLESYGGMRKLRDDFIETGTKQFGSGWVWVVLTADGRLDVVGTQNAEPPQVHGMKPLLTCDVWEHAYYLDYQNERGEFLEVFFDHLANWSFAAEQVRQQGEGNIAAGRQFQDEQHAFSGNTAADQ